MEVDPIGLDDILGMDAFVEDAAGLMDIKMETPGSQGEIPMSVDEGITPVVESLPPLGESSNQDLLGLVGDAHGAEVHSNGDINMGTKLSIAEYTAVKAEALDSLIEPPPPPPPNSSAPADHVDVDLGPLKSVSRNHARISFRAELGLFCLEIYGRNGAWVDDRYYVRGSTVPLNQG
jgi:hypothetical protein